MASNQRQRKAVGLKRLALLGFAGLLVLLFVAIAIAQGVGDPSIPEEAVAIVEDAPDDLGTVTEEEFRRAFVQAAAAAQIEPVPKPGDEQYDGLKETALGEVFDSIWIQGQAAEMGISVTPQEVAAELEKLKEQSFQNETQYQEFLKESRYTPEDVDRRVTVQILSTNIQNQIQEEAPAPSKAEIEDYYEAVKASQYTTPESREIRLVVNKDKAQVEAAKAQLEKDDSVESWEEVAKKYSSDPATKNKGGLQSGLSEGGLAEPLNAAVFGGEQGELGGPLKETRGFVIFEVVSITQEKVQSLEEAEPQITTQLSEQTSQQDFTAFLRNYNSTWRSRTFCASDVVFERCANFKGDGRPAEANPACYEAEPAEPPEACPALIIPAKPAMPGSVNLQTPEGQQLSQRPRPAKAEAAATAAPEGAEEPPVEAAPEGN